MVRNYETTVAMQQSRTIALAMFQYANDNDGRYPNGNNSTEVFQKLVDGNYIGDPDIFYVPFSGKTRALPGERLKPENVSFDVTDGANPNSSQGVPLVFLTGYKVDYRPGGNAVSLIAPYPPYAQRTWSEWWQGKPKQDPKPFLAVCYVSHTAFAKNVTVPPGGFGYVLHFVPPDFDAHGKVYRQLTPDGVMK